MRIDIVLIFVVSIVLFEPASFGHEGGHELVPPVGTLSPAKRLMLASEDEDPGLGNAGGVAAALGTFVYRGALSPAAVSLSVDEIGTGLMLAGVVFFAGLKIWNGIQVWSASIPIDLQSTEITDVILPARRTFYGIPNTSSTSALGIAINW